VLETLVHVASASRFDRFVHEEQHLSSLESFDFGALSKKGEGEEKRVRTKNDVVALLRTQGDSWCQWLEGLPESFLSEQVRQPGGAHSCMGHKIASQSDTRLGNCDLRALKSVERNNSRPSYR